MSDDRLKSLVRQHAATAQLLGVDFVPAYRPAGSESPVEISSTVEPPAPVYAPAAKPVPAPAAPPRRHAPTVEVAPVTQPAASRHAAKAASGPMVELPASKDRDANTAALAALRARYEADAPHDAFGITFNNIVFGEGDAAARLCFVGEAPGEDEDLSGRPFVGRAGQLLEKMIVAMGLSRAEVYICNVLKVRPPGNRTPTTDEVLASKPYLLEQLSIVRPEAIVGLGLSATHALLEVTDPMSRLRGRWWEILDSRGRAVPFMPTYHPAFLLRSYTEENRAKVWSDLKMVMDKLGMSTAKRG